MNRYVRFKIITEDKIGITLQILEKLYTSNINLISIEVFPKKIYIKIEKISENKKISLMEDITSMDEVKSINEVELLTYEANERKLLALIDSVDDGIMAVNKNFQIETFNRYCEKIFHYKREEVIGKDVRTIIKEDAPIINLVKSRKDYTNLEFISKNERGNSHYIATGRHIKDDNGNTLGWVSSIRDMKKAIEMAKVVSYTKEGAFNEIVGNSIVIERTKKIAHTVAKGSSTILIRGESGTGKELFAKAIHNLSLRMDKPFIAINCAALPDSLIESELFGYEKGSFTGALNSGKDGLIKEADGGTLFLDEIGELSMVLQAKLLRVLQNSVVRKIGSSREEKVDVRIIGATNRNLEEMIKKKSFREDLYYRLNVIPLYIPPLRDRSEDIPSLVNYFIEELNLTLNKNIVGVDIGFMNKLLEYHWPGNIRELKNIVERAMNLSSSNVLTIDSLMLDINPHNFNRELGDDDKCLTLKESIEKVEKASIIEALQKHKSLRKTAKALGVTHTTIINKINKYNIKWK